VIAQKLYVKIIGKEKMKKKKTIEEDFTFWLENTAPPTKKRRINNGNIGNNNVVNDSPSNLSSINNDNTANDTSLISNNNVNDYFSNLPSINNNNGPFSSMNDNNLINDTPSALSYDENNEEYIIMATRFLEYCLDFHNTNNNNNPTLNQINTDNKNIMLLFATISSTIIKFERLEKIIEQLTSENAELKSTREKIKNDLEFIMTQHKIQNIRLR